MSNEIHRAGMVPYWICPQTNEIHMYFMKPSHPDYGGDRYQIAKGRIEDGLNELETAIKEAQEELGLRVSNMVSQPMDVGTFMKGIHVYMVQVKDRADFDTPHYETGSAAWLTLKEFEAIGREINMNAIYNIHRLIVKTHKLPK